MLDVDNGSHTRGCPPVRGATLTQDALTVLRLIGATVAYLGVLSGVSLLLVLVALVWLPGAEQGAVGLLGLAVAEACALLAVVLVWRRLGHRPVSELGLSWRRVDGVGPGRQWLRGAGVGGLMMGLIVLGWYTLVDGAVWSSSPNPGRATLALVVGFVGFLIQGPSEEVLFRGYILEEVRGRWGAGWAVGVSSVTFALLHLGNPSFGPLPLVNLILFGVAAGLYKLRVDGGHLWGVFALHSIWNWLQQVVFGLPNSGNASLPDNTLFVVQPNLAVPDAVSGGGFGPEGTLAATLVLLGLIVAVLRLGGAAGVARRIRPTG